MARRRNGIETCREGQRTGMNGYQGPDGRKLMNCRYKKHAHETKRSDSDKSHANHNCSHASTWITNHYAYTIEKQVLGKAED